MTTLLHGTARFAHSTLGRVEKIKEVGEGSAGGQNGSTGYKTLLIVCFVLRSNSLGELVLNGP